MERYEGKVAVVTGASVGIGASLSKKLVAKGLNVVGLARRLDLLEELAITCEGPGKFYPLKCDLLEEEEILKAFEWVRENLGPVHILVNNAGVISPSELLEAEGWQLKRTINVNVIAVALCTKEAIKSMRENNIDGHIVNISSIMGHINFYFPDLNIYAASKHALRAMTMSYKLELEQIGSKIRVGCVSPGIVETEFLDQFTEENKVLFASWPKLSAEDTANAAMFVLSQPPHVNVTDVIVYPS